MLITFVIGLREGLEAALVVGIVAACLVQRGRADALRHVWAGVVLAVLICLGVGVGLWALTSELDQAAQEALETVIGLVAVAMVTWMIVWMGRHARTMASELRASTERSLAAGSLWALVGMAFLAVMREGIETVVFLLAVFRSATDRAAASFGAVAGIAVAVVLGHLFYRGGVRIDLARFFRITGVVLVLVAAGLLVGSAHTAHEAGWLDAGQQRVLDLSAVAGEGRITNPLFAGLLGIPATPVLAEVVLWLAYTVPMLVLVLRPRRGAAPHPNPRKVAA